MRKKFVIIAWAVYALLVALVVLAFVGIKRGWVGYMPPLDELQTPISRYASQVISADGRVLGTWSRSENRVFADYDSIAPCVFAALVATEDERFYQHSGIDFKALARAVVKRGLLRQREAGGGSTITQQLAKQLYSTTAQTTRERLMQKPVEWVIAVELERRYTKEEILTLYLNYFDFLHNAVGIKTAAGVYFGKQPADLRVEEAAMLVGMCKNPSLYNPLRAPERCRERRNVVLAQMARAGHLTQAQADSLALLPLGTDYHRVDHKDGLAPYLREHLRRTLTARKPRRSDYGEAGSQQYHADSMAWETDPLYGWCNKNFKRDGKPYDIYTDGLKIYTTIDSRMQDYAEESVRGHMSKLQEAFEKENRGSANYPYSPSVSPSEARRSLRQAKVNSERYRLMRQQGASDEQIEAAFNTPVPMTVFFYNDGKVGYKDVEMTPLDSIRYYKAFLRAGLVSLDPATGYVKAYVGGPDFTHFQYDMATMGRRQIGSTMKPFVYTMAMEDGYTPESTILNVQRTYGNWTPRNGSRARYGEDVTLKWGLSQSNNWVTAELMYQIDPNGTRLKDYLHQFGVVNNEIYPSLPLCLGATELTVGELAGAYTAFVNKGIRCAPILVTRIEDGAGNVLAEFSPRMYEVISERTSYLMLDMLRAVVDQGTGRRLRFKYHLTAPIAGKTGTSNDNADGWFVGCVPRLVTACWVGGEERSIRFRSMALGQGASSALPIWAYYMTKVYRDGSLHYSQDEKFAVPKPAPVDSVGVEQPELPPADELPAHDPVDSYFE